jgi:hypothetical protein
MILKFRVFDEQIESYTSKGAERKNRVLSLLDDSSEGKKLKQVVDLSLDAETPAVGIGSTITVEVTEFQEFSGRPRIRGTILTQDKGGKSAAAPVRA